MNTNMTLTAEQIDKLALACGVQRRGRSDEVLFEACLRMIRLNLGSPA
jgi:hypothetical protein